MSTRNVGSLICSGNATWSALVKVLYSDDMNENRVAEERATPDYVNICNQVHSHAPSIGCGAASELMEQSQKDQLRNVLETVLSSMYDDLSNLLSTSLQAFSQKMFQNHLITETCKDTPVFKEIMKEFTAGMRFLNIVQDYESHCLSLILVLQSVGGPALKAADKLEREWTVQVLNEMQIDFTIIKPPQQPEDQSHLHNSAAIRNIYYSQRQMNTHPHSCDKRFRHMKHNLSYRNEVSRKISMNLKSKSSKPVPLQVIWEDSKRQILKSPSSSDDYFSVGSQASSNRSMSLWNVPDQSSRIASTMDSEVHWGSPVSDPSCLLRSSVSDSSMPNMDPHSDFVPPDPRDTDNNVSKKGDTSPQSIKHPELSDSQNTQGQNELVTGGKDKGETEEEDGDCKEYKNDEVHKARKESERGSLDKSIISEIQELRQMLFQIESSNRSHQDRLEQLLNTNIAKEKDAYKLAKQKDQLSKQKDELAKQKDEQIKMLQTQVQEYKYVRIVLFILLLVLFFVYLFGVFGCVVLSKH